MELLPVMLILIVSWVGIYSDFILTKLIPSLMSVFILRGPATRMISTMERMDGTCVILQTGVELLLLNGLFLLVTIARYGLLRQARRAPRLIISECPIFHVLLKLQPDIMDGPMRVDGMLRA